MKTYNTRKIIRNILQQTYVENDHLFHLRGREFKVTQKTAYWQWNGPMSSFGENTGATGHEREKLINEIAGAIYSSYYMTGNPEGEWQDEHVTVSAEDKSEFMKSLSEANQTIETWDPLWTVSSVDPSGNVTVQKNNTTRTLVRNEWQPMQPLNGPLQPGMNVSVLLRREKKDAQPVFYYVYSQEPMPYPASLARIYFNVKPSGIQAFLRDLTATFNRYRLPFMFKCLNHPKLYTRADSAVLYIEKSRFTITARLLAGILKKHDKSFNENIPLFTRGITNGVSFAEDPGNNKSFGMFWSEIIAEGIVKIYESGTTEERREEFVFDQIRKKGMLPEAPHMRANSFYPYDFSLFK